MPPSLNKEDLRDHVGVAAIIRDSNGQVLIQRHNKFKFNTIPMGKAQPGETPLQALKTELKEELGLDVLKAKQLTVDNKTYQHKSGSVNVKLHVFDVTDYSGTPTNLEPNKHEWIKFMPVKSIDNLTNTSDALKAAAPFIKSAFERSFVKNFIKLSEEDDVKRQKLRIAAGTALGATTGGVLTPIAEYAGRSRSKKKDIEHLNSIISDIKKEYGRDYRKYIEELKANPHLTKEDYIKLREHRKSWSNPKRDSIYRGFKNELRKIKKSNPMHPAIRSIPGGMAHGALYGGIASTAFVLGDRKKKNKALTKQAKQLSKEDRLKEHKDALRNSKLGLAGTAGLFGGLTAIEGLAQAKKKKTELINQYKQNESAGRHTARELRDKRRAGERVNELTYKRYLKQYQEGKNEARTALKGKEHWKHGLRKANKSAGATVPLAMLFGAGPAISYVAEKAYLNKNKK